MVEKNIPGDAAVSTKESQVKEVVHVVKEVTPVQEEYEDFTLDRHEWTLLSDEDFTP